MTRSADGDRSAHCHLPAVPRLALCVSALVALTACAGTGSGPLPVGFVYLRDIDPTIRQDMRYATEYNFTGRPVPGYRAPECVLTRAAARALEQVQADLRPLGYGLKVYDCYRPVRAVQSFVAWAADPARQSMKRVFYPRVEKSRVIELGYIASRSGHSRGSTVDLAIVRLNAPGQPVFKAAAVSGTCNAGRPANRPPDNTLDFGTGYDCFDTLSHTANLAIRGVARRNRALLVRAMVRHGFENYAKEWWHFTLRDEPYPKRAFDFPIVPRP